MPERPPSGPSSREISPVDAALDALVKSTEKALEIERRIAAALKKADPNDPKSLDLLEELFAEAREHAKREAENFAAWRAAYKADAEPK